MKILAIKDKDEREVICHDKVIQCIYKRERFFALFWLLWNFLMNFLMLLQIGRLGEGFLAHGALERFVSGVNSHMGGEIEGQRKSLSAIFEWTAERTLTRVDQSVAFQLKIRSFIQ